MLRFPHQFSTKIENHDRERIKEQIQKFLTGEEPMPDETIVNYVLVTQAKKVIQTAKDKQAAFDELAKFKVWELIEQKTGTSVVTIDDLEKLGEPVNVDEPPLIPQAVEDFIEQEGITTGKEKAIDKAMGVVPQQKNYGGIDMNNIDVKNKGPAADIWFDPEAFEKYGAGPIQGFSPVIISLTPVSDILPELGLK
jgi:hypothetical protein